VPPRKRIGREAKTLLTKSLDSLSVAIELFNRPHDRGRTCSVILLLDHSFEMLLKSALVHRKCNIQDDDSSHMMGFEKCLNKAFSDCVPAIIDVDEKRLIWAINALRNAFQHYIVDVDEVQLYLHVQGGTTIFRTILFDTFCIDLAERMPRRVLAISTIAMPDIQVYFDRKMAEFQTLLAPGRRRRQEAISALRSFEILNRALQDEDGQPSTNELLEIVRSIRNGSDWKSIFQGIAQMQIDESRSGHVINLWMTKGDGFAVHRSTDESLDQPIIAIREVDKLSRFSLTPTSMAKHLGIAVAHFTALSRHLELESNDHWFFLLRVGAGTYKRYSLVCLEYAKEELAKLSADEWQAVRVKHLPRGRRKVRRVVL